MNFPYDRAHLLSLASSDFEADVRAFVGGNLNSDLRHQDRATNLLGELGKEVVTAAVVSKSEGILCGRPLVDWLLREVQFEGQVVWRVEEGGALTIRQPVLQLIGEARTILAVERTLLNVLQRLSGIATVTRRLMALAHPTPLAATRKTGWGLLDKYAVHRGGGLTHRLTLGDAPMFKDNHWALLPGGVEALWPHLLTLKADPFVTLEIESEEHLTRALACAHRAPLQVPLFLLLDNFAVESLRRFLPHLKRPHGVYLELSGGITESSLASYAALGADVISMGALTHSAVALDFSLRVLGPQQRLTE